MITLPFTTRGAIVIVYGPLGVDGHHRPDHLAGLRVERLEPAVERARVHAAAVDRDAAVHDVAARDARRLARHLRVVAPEQLPRARVDREHHAPAARRVDHAVDDDRRRLVAARELGVEVPGESELLRRWSRRSARAGCSAAPHSCRRRSASSAARPAPRAGGRHLRAAAEQPLAPAAPSTPSAASARRARSGHERAACRWANCAQPTEGGQYGWASFAHPTHHTPTMKLTLVVPLPPMFSVCTFFAPSTW